MSKHVVTMVDILVDKKKVSDLGCGECQASCQSACKTSSTVGNQDCENLSRDSQV